MFKKSVTYAYRLMYARVKFVQEVYKLYSKPLNVTT